MHDTEFQLKLAQLCRRNKGFARHLVSEIRRSKTAALSKKGEIYDDYMSWQALHKIIDRAPELLELLKTSGQDLEDWQETQLQLASEYLDTVYDALRYRPDDDGV